MRNLYVQKVVSAIDPGCLSPMKRELAAEKAAKAKLQQHYNKLEATHKVCDPTHSLNGLLE